MMFTPTDEPASTSEPETKPTAKITQRMLQIRDLIEQGTYPDKDELAERIVDAGVKPRS
jgi:hypothetical protein